MSGLPSDARSLLRWGTLCYLAAPSPGGPHVTPVVFALDRSRLWATTSRGAVKAAAWRRHPVAGGLVQVGERAVAFRGTVTLYDALDPFTWPAVAFRAPAVVRASTKFTLKNARFFAGYARDARRVPLSWTPPGRIAVSVDLEAGAVLEGEDLVDTWGEWGSEAAGRTSFRAARRSAFPDGELPEELGELVAPAGRGVLGLEGGDAPVVLPVRWARADGAYYAVLPRPLLALAGAPAEGQGSLVVDRASAWRAARMAGLMLRGPADVFLPGEVRSGRTSLLALARRAGPLPGEPAVVRLRPERAVWWSGWASGTVRAR
ncbi:MAG: pyridoxamine 5'-phosphate oxidase family protein [Actinomycetota bacterium]